MQVTVEVPKAFSVSSENEMFPIQHLMARLNPELIVKQIATAMHVNGGGTVLWGLVYQEGRPLSKKSVHAALREAGLDFEQSDLAQAVNVCDSLPWEGSAEEAEAAL